VRKLPVVVVANESLLRLGAFAGVLAVMALWEVLAPRRHQAIGRGRRWPGNLGVVLVDIDYNLQFLQIVRRLHQTVK